MPRSDDINNEKANRARNKQKALFYVIGCAIGFISYNICKAFGLV